MQQMIQSMHAKTDPIGVIEEIHGPVVDVMCDRLPPLHQALFCAFDHEYYPFEVYRHLDARRIRVIALHPTGGLKRHLPVFDSGRPLRIPVTPDCLGRLLDIFGAPLDDGPSLNTSEMRNIIAPPALLAKTVPAEGILETGIKVIYAEYLRDTLGKEVLLLMDNVFCFVQAGSEISGLLGRMPATVGYQPTLMSEVAELQERIISTRGGDITAVEAVYVPGDDMTDPAVSTILSHLDTTVILSRSQAAKGIYPTVDPLQSSSKMMGRVFWGTGITQWLRMYVSIWRVTRSWKTLLPCWGWRRYRKKTGAPLCVRANCSVIYRNPSMLWPHILEFRVYRSSWIKR